MASLREQQLSLADVLLPEYAENPYPLYQRLREIGPMRWDAHLERWIATGYAEVLTVLHDPRFSAHVFALDISGLDKNLQAKFQPTLDIFSQMMFLVDPPQHTRLRNLVARAFTPRMVDMLRPQVQFLVRQLLDAVMERGEMELLHDFAYRVPTTVIATVLGIPPEDHALFFHWANDIDELAEEYPTAPEQKIPLLASATDCIDYFRRHLQQRAQRPGDDLLQALLDAREHEDRLSEHELLGTCLLLLVGGLFTTTHLISNGFYALLRHPEQYHLLREQPELLPQAVVELLRYDTPMQEAARRALVPVEIAGQQIQPGQIVLASLGAANRDPQQFPDPDRLDILRPEHRHMSFGYGIHFCIGAALGRLEAEIALHELTRRFASPVVKQVKWETGRALRGLKHFSFTF